MKIKGMKIKGPTATCSDLKDVLSNPPHDMTDRKKLIATLSKDACALPVNDITTKDVLENLKGKKIAYTVDDETLTVYARHNEDKAITCCSLQPNLKLIGQHNEDYLFAYRFHLKSLENARLEFFSPDFMQNQDKEKINYTGHKASPNLIFNKGELAGQILTKTFDSQALGEKRLYDLYIPKGFKPDDNAGIVILGDGRSLGFHIRQWEPMIVSGQMRNFVAIGVRSGRRAIVDPKEPYDFDVRNADYIHGYKKGPQRFDQHLSFVADELLPSVKSELGLDTPAEKTVLIGGSSAGSFALWGTMKRPDVFGVSIGMSPSGPIPEDVSSEAATRTYYISAGIYEPGFRANAIGYESVLKSSNATTDLKSYPDGHSADQRAQRMVEVLPLIFPVQKND